MLVSAAELAGELGQADLLVLHVHEREATYEAGHIPGARFIRYSTFAVDDPGGLGAELPAAEELGRVLRAAGVRRDQRVVIYSQSPLMAARLFFTLDDAGHANVALLDGGLRAWQAAGRPVETGAPPAPVTPGDFTPRIDAGRMATAGWIE
ncbi:MAG: sulfurtransferase, partial [Vicinamibacterales bacterium]